MQNLPKLTLKGETNEKLDIKEGDIMKTSAKI